MTVHLYQNDQNNFIEITCIDKLTHEDYEKVLIPQLDSYFQNHKKMRALADLSKFKGMEARALWDDFKYGIKHLKDVERIATIGDQKWVEVLMKIGHYITPNVELRHFHKNQKQEAQIWLNAN